MKLEPLFDNVVVRVQPQQDRTTKSGLVMSEKSPELVFAEVMATGPGRLTDYGVTVSTGVRAGERVVLPVGAGSDIMIDGEVYRLVRGHDIRATVKP